MTLIKSRAVMTGLEVMLSLTCIYYPHPWSQDITCIYSGEFLANLEGKFNSAPALLESLVPKYHTETS